MANYSEVKFGSLIDISPDELDQVMAPTWRSSTQVMADERPSNSQEPISMLTKAERNYCVTRKELLAVVSAVKRFHHYLYGRQFLVRSDHGALKWLLNFKNPEGQLARWLELLGTYDMHIEHMLPVLGRALR